MNANVGKLTKTGVRKRIPCRFLWNLVIHQITTLILLMFFQKKITYVHIYVYKSYIKGWKSCRKKSKKNKKNHHIRLSGYNFTFNIFGVRMNLRLNTFEKFQNSKVKVLLSVIVKIYYLKNIRNNATILYLLKRKRVSVASVQRIRIQLNPKQGATSGHLECCRRELISVTDTMFQCNKHCSKPLRNTQTRTYIFF